MNNNKQKILLKIKENIKDKKPIPSWVVRGTQIGVLSICATLILGAVFLIAMFIFDFFEKRSVENFLNQSVYGPQHFLYEYLVVAICLVFVFIFIYRKFDLPGVKDRNKIFALSVLVAVVLGLGMAELAENFFAIRNSMQSIKSTYVNNVPIRNSQRLKARSAIKSNSVYIGKLSQVNESTDVIDFSAVDKTDGIKTFKIDKKFLKEELRVGDKVMIKMSSDGGTIIKIKIIK
ncbi:MAG: hypothetical protein NTX85_04145 [Candidatus Nomurabacteria bacterium]|nr:hypothetical protein [Candidatus Nomurabacteria bacterium]